MGNVPDEVTDIDLADYFSNVGEVLSAQIRGNDGGHYAFLEFAYPDDVHRVLSLAQDQPFEMCAQPLKVQPRRPKDQHQVSTFSCRCIRGQSLMSLLLVVCPLQAFLNRSTAACAVCMQTATPTADALVTLAVTFAGIADSRPKPVWSV